MHDILCDWCLSPWDVIKLSVIFYTRHIVGADYKYTDFLGG